MAPSETLRQQSLEMMDRALVATGTERLVLLAEALRLHRLSREAEGDSYPAIPDAITPASEPDTAEGAAEDDQPPSPEPA
jgi:hypothetical protein